MRKSVTLTLCSLLCLCVVVGRVHANSSTDIMSCVMCEMVSESVTSLKTATPAAALSLMYRRCGQMGLIEPVCDQLVDDNARQILGMTSVGVPSKEICRELKLCDR